MEHKCKKTDLKTVEKCELNREQIIKALECCVKADTHYDCISLNCPALINNECIYTGITEQECNRKQFADALSLIKELTEENERLRNRITCQIVLPDEKLEEIKNECLSRVKLDIKAIQADTLTELKNRLTKAIGTYTKESYVYVHAWFTLIDQITKEILGDA